MKQMNNTNELNYKNFWRSNLKYRTTNTGMNSNIISKDIPYIGKREYLDQKIDHRLYLTSEQRMKRRAFIETINNCLINIYSEGRGFIFTDEQLTEVRIILPNVRFSWDKNNCCYSCRR